jgi:hypothetical protein
LKEKREEKERKNEKRIEKNRYGKGGFPWGWTYLSGCAAGYSC